MRIVWTEPAAWALESIQDHIARDNRRAAWEVAQRVRKAVNQLQEHPRMGRSGRVRGTMELVIPGLPYVVPYRLKDGDIQILSVFHEARKWPEQFE
ncbi:type II toxin-antitoxin system RelE/ParE family toxin [Seongchinamella sediminis]|uniref:Type II toxin-antitoxin system RelE/ParE family toxin n=1 Tax=Seongchinamella sediminis TaxID=2283635 RepID=A0A3L7E321_9GAMM|nr:type II toxin-antitoxin system RelE/ParE family toxin [Seongchinamella sediminis]